jgi:hypothetical protein
VGTSACPTPNHAQPRYGANCFQHQLEQGLATNLTPGYCWSTSFKVLRVLFLGEIYSGFCLQRRHVGRTNFATWGLANSIRPLNRHSPSCPLTPPLRGQKPAPDTLCTKPPRHSPAVTVPPASLGSRLRNMAPFRQELPVSLWRREIPMAAKPHAMPIGMASRLGGSRAGR